MKRLGIIISALVISLGAFAQNDIDALRYSWNNILCGSARYTAMGGAFSALGGDVGVLSTNPAGLGMYRSSEFVFTPTLMYNNTEADYLKSKYQDERYNFNLNNLAYVGTITSGLSGDWESISLTLGYNRKNNYNQNTLIGGDMINENLSEGTLHSLLDNFVWYASMDDPYGVSYHRDFNPNGDYLLDEHYEELAYHTDLILYFNDTINGGYWWNEFNDDGYGQSQQKSIKTTGSNGEYYFGIGANYGHMLYMGASMALHHFREEIISVHTETDYQSTIDYIRFFEFEESFTTWGNGFDMKFGAIYRPVEFVRLSGAFHTPTFYRVNVERSNMAETGFDPEYSLANLFYYSQIVGYREYNLRTPFKAVGGLAIQFDKYALLSFDYEFTDYSKMHVDYDGNPEKTSFVNQIIDEKYDATHNIRGGVELRNGPLSLRGGAAYYDSPFNSDEINKDAYSIFYTGGLGLRSDNFYIDFAYVFGTHSEIYSLYELPQEEDPTGTYPNFPDTYAESEIKSKYNKFMVTLGFRF